MVEIDDWLDEDSILDYIEMEQAIEPERKEAPSDDLSELEPDFYEDLEDELWDIFF